MNVLLLLASCSTSKALVTTSKAPVTTSKALVTTSVATRMFFHVFAAFQRKLVTAEQNSYMTCIFLDKCPNDNISFHSKPLRGPWVGDCSLNGA